MHWWHMFHMRLVLFGRHQYQEKALFSKAVILQYPIQAASEQT